MIHYYCFVPTLGKISATTKVFKVAVGSSSDDIYAKMCVEDFAKRSLRYFHLWNASAELEISSRLVRTETDPNSCSLGFQCIHVPVKKLWRAILNQTVWLLEDEPHGARNYRQILSILSPKFFLLHAQSSAASALPHLTRKNLSVRPSTDDICAALGFAALVFLYWLGCLICNLEKILL